MGLVLLIAAPFAITFLGGLALIWWACERLARLVRHARAVDE